MRRPSCASRPAATIPNPSRARSTRRFSRAHLAPAQVLTRAMFRDALDEHFKVVGDVLQMVALAAALLGAIILAAGTAFNVLERTREIGVMRALGATVRGIAAMLLAEGAAIALVAALLSVGDFDCADAGAERRGSADAAACRRAAALLAGRPCGALRRRAGRDARRGALRLR